MNFTIICRMVKYTFDVFFLNITSIHLNLLLTLFFLSQNIINWISLQ